MNRGILKAAGAVLLIAGLAGVSLAKDADNNDGIKTVSLEERRGRNHEKMMKEMAEKLGLTADQQKQLSDLMKAGAEKRKEEMKQRGARNKEMREANDNALGKILTPEQMVKFKEMRKAGRPAFGNMPRGMGGQLDGPAVRGKVESVDTATRTLTLKGREKTETISVPADIQVKKAGQTVQFTEIAAGDMVMAGYREENGKKIVTSLFVMPKRGPGPEGKIRPHGPRGGK